MGKRRVFFIHPHYKDLDSFLQYIKVGDISNRLEWDGNSPEILFASEWIYYDRSCYKTFVRLWPRAKVKIMYCGEAIEPDMNLFDYVVGFTNNLYYNGRYIRLLSPLDMFVNFITERKNSICSIENAREVLKFKTKFCNFLYSNPKANPMRDKLFYEISKYKKVDSLGKHLNNVDKMGTGYGGHASECVGMKSDYKFSIASENSSYTGYTSEKIFTSLLAHSVPIYWGNNDIEEDVNPEVFINAAKFTSLGDLVNYVKYVDTHDDVWVDMISKPWMTSEQEDKHQKRTQVYKEKLISILTEECKYHQHLAFGTHVDMYRDHYFNNIYPMNVNKNIIYRGFSFLRDKITKGISV